MNNFALSVNTGFAVNRYSEHHEWIKIVGKDLNLRRAQITADILNVSLPTSIIEEHTAQILRSCDKYDVEITSSFTGAFTRVNHLAHPDPSVRDYWIAWFKKFVDLSVNLGCTSLGSHFGIFTHKDNSDKDARKLRRKQNIDAWHQIGEYAADKGLRYISWEPMSINREQGETLENASKLQFDVNYKSPIPFKICLDVDHGDISSSNPNNYNPYVWLAKFADQAPLIHLKQSNKNKSGHWPFTAEHNAVGIIEPKKVIDTLINNGNTDAELILEISFREREPADSSVIEVLKESVDYWRPFVSAKN